MDGSTALAVVFDSWRSPHTVLKESYGAELDVAAATGHKLVRLVLNVYGGRVKRAFSNANRMALVFDGSCFRGEDFEVIIGYSRRLNVAGVLQPQVTFCSASCLKCV